MNLVTPGLAMVLLLPITNTASKIQFKYAVEHPVSHLVLLP